MTMINLTPHTVVLVNGNYRKVYRKAGPPIRTSLDWVHKGMLDGFPIQSTRNLIDLLPPVIKDTYYIVSAVVLQQARYLGRQDFVAPDSNHAVRDSAGTVISVPGWVV